MKKRRIKRRTPSKIYREALSKWTNLVNKGVSINFSEFYGYMRDITKANKLGEKIKKRADSLAIPRFTRSEKVFTSAETFKKYQSAVKRVNKRGYVEEQNRIIRERFIENLRANTNVSEETINKIKNMSNAEFKNFAKNNAELNSIIYGFYNEDNSANELITMLDLNNNAIESRVNEAIR